ncbi:MAG: hypothetical protein LIO77_06375 [Rikenellaceae bacterium]|nr:hypothetical protein [Rikenellaceae bacterium]
MKKSDRLKRNPMQAALALAFTLVVVAGCSSGNSGSEGDPAGNMAAVIERLEKNTDLTEFTESLKGLQNSIKEADITVIAVKNVAFGDDDAEIASSDITRHVIKGAWPLDKLKAASQVESVDGTKLAVEYYSDAGIEVLYVNDMVVDLDPSSVGNSIIYTTDAFMPATTALPSPTDDDYLKAIGRKIEGRWVMTGHTIYSIYMPDANTSQTTETSSSEHIGCGETFYWSPKSMNTVSGYYGEYELYHSCGSGTSIGAVGVNRRREEGVWKVSSTSEPGFIASLEFGFDMAGYRRSVSYFLQGPGVGSIMKYYVMYPGEELNPPNMYPAQKKEEMYTLRKLSNRP